MKKIIFIANNNIGTGFSGGDRIFVEFLKNWKDKVKIIIFASEEAKIISEKRGANNINIIETDNKNNSKNYFTFRTILKHIFKRTIKGISALKNNKNLTKDVDYVYSVSDFYPDFIPAFWLKLKNKNIKWIAGYYLFAPNPFSKKSPYKGKNRLKGLFYSIMQLFSYFIINKFADFIFITSEPDVKKFMTKKRDCSKIFVIRGGVDITESEKYLSSNSIIPIKNRKYDCCFLGRLHPQKGVLILLDIWKKIIEIEPYRTLAIIGDGELEFEVKEKIKKLNLINSIYLFGFLDGEEKFKIFKESKIMLHPAIYDSGGMAMAEGMAWRLPGVSFDLEALKTYYPKGVIKVDCFDINKFANNIIGLLNNSELYDRFSKEAHDLILNEWDWNKKSENIFNLLNK